MFNQMECPCCGNEVTAESIKVPQKCPWCRRLYKVDWKREGRKIHWTIDTAEFHRPNKSFSKFEMSQEGMRGYEEVAATNIEEDAWD